MNTLIRSSVLNWNLKIQTPAHKYIMAEKRSPYCNCVTYAKSWFVYSQQGTTRRRRNGHPSTIQSGFDLEELLVEDSSVDAVLVAEEVALASAPCHRLHPSSGRSSSGQRLCTAAL